MSPAQAPRDLADDFLLLHHRLSVGGGRDAAMRRIVELAVGSIPGCDWAAITVWSTRGQPKSLVTSDETAEAADRLQYELGEGPCLSAAPDSKTVHLTDVARDDRWARFSAAALVGTPVRSVLSFHLADRPHRSALNLYSACADTLDVSAASLFAAHARVLLIHAASADKAANLETALGTSRQIGAAIGILMNVHKITADQAFDLLRQDSQRLNRKLHDIAYDVTLTGALPDAR